jgi:hypothetical protein
MGNELLNKKTISEYLTHEAAWQWSHGADQDYLGMGLLYYTIVYASKAEVAVCLGSGGGFVPRLMRQAQRDLGIANISRTILIDGNIPEAGWGAPTWLAEDSFFKKHFPDVEVIVDLTRNAAETVFERQQIQIDYLHVDADHSFDGCLADFETYRRFLHEGSIVTLHDTNCARAAVKHVVEHLRTLSDCDVVDFPNVGEGTALVRIGKPAGDSRFKLVNTAHSKNGSGISVTRHADTLPLAPQEKEWKYLESRAFATRYVLAAHWVKSCRSVIEIGGSRTSIDSFLTGSHDSVLVLDPFIREFHGDTLRGRPCDVSYVRARFQDVDWHLPAGTDYGLVMLGLEIQGLEAYHYQVLYQLINQARVTVIEFPPSWDPSREQFDQIRNNTKTNVAIRIKLDLEGNDFGDLSNSWPPRCHREIYVLVPCNS